MKRLSVLLALFPALASAQFALHNGDRVVFYGDSITDQRLYTLYTETFVRTRFPKLDVSFVHSGWGGDRVSGGGGGDIDTRLTRDVLAYHPTVTTIMLGMNDAAYRAYDQNIFNDYAKGYRHIVDRLKKEDPHDRLTLIIPSPYDDVTRAPGFTGGYNAVLLQYGAFVSDLAKESGSTVANLNAPVVAMLQNANAKDPNLAQKIIPDRVHPGDAGHMTMAEALLKAWNAPSVVSAVEISGTQVHTTNAKVSDLHPTGGGVAWTQQDGALPYPVNMGDPSVKLVLDSSDFVSALDQQTVKVSGLSGRYTLLIDDKPVGAFSGEELGAGVNIATLNTPMMAQSQRVLALVRDRAEAHNQRWRSIETNWFLGPEKAAAKEKEGVFRALDKYADALDKEARKAAQPVPHRFALVPAR